VVNNSKGSAHIFIILIVIILGVWIFISQGFINLPFSNQLSSLDDEKVVSEPSITLKTQYQNPFDKTSQYVNPFAETKNPFDALK